MLDTTQSSPNLDLPLVMPDQAQKHVTVNESLLRLDALVQARARSRARADEPAEPGEGDLWILPDGAHGETWSHMQAGSLASWRDGFWTEIPPRVGWRVWCETEAVDLEYGPEGWRTAPEQAVLATGQGGSATQALVIEHITENPVGTSLVTGAILPARSIVFCVSVRTLDAVSGATSFDCGIAGETSKFGGSLGVSAGASNLGVIGPTAFYSDTPVILTANGGGFTGGRIGIAVHAWVPVAMAG